MSEIRLRLLPALHLSTLSPATLEKAFKQLHRASACCYMYVATLFPRVWPSSEITCLLEFSEYSSAPGLFDQPLVTQFLWAAFWLIMRNEENRTYLVNLLLDEIEKNGGGGEDGEKKDGQNDSGDAEESNAEELQPDPSQENEAIPEGAAAAIEDMEGNHQRFMDVTLRVMENFFPCLAELVPPAWTDDKKQSPSLYLYSFCFGAIWLFSYNDDDQRQLHEDVYRQNEIGWPKTEARMLDLDMRRMLDSSRTKGFLKREGEKVGKDVETVVAELNDIFKQVWDDLYGAFMWYSLQGSGDPYCMQLNAFSQFTDDCKIPDSESEKCKRSDLDTLFIVANFEEDKNSALSKFNDDNSLMRFEFMDILIRMGIAKYGNGALTEDPVEAFRELLDRNVFLHLGSEAIVKANDFRSNRLYNEETDHYLRTRKQLLQAMYSRYRLKPAAGGLRPKVLRIEGWLQMIEHTNLLSINNAFTINQAKYCFMFARMIVIDELKDEKRWRSLTFVDFLDALGRVADNFSFPFKDDLRRLGWNNIYEYMEYAAYTAEEDVAGKIFPSRTSAGFSAPKTRPLKGKVEALLDLMFMRIAFNADDPNYEYSDAYLLKLLRKQDKDLGP